MKIAVIILALLGAFPILGQFPQSQRVRDRLDRSREASEAREHARRMAEAEKAEALPVPKKAVMNVDVQMVISKADVKTFAEAKTAVASKIADGEPLWMYVKFNGKLGDYVLTTRHPEDPAKRRYTLFAEIAPRGDVTALHQFSIQFTKEDLAATELKISLAPALFGRNRSVPVFLMTTSAAKNGVWNNEVRLTNTVAIPRALTENLASSAVTLSFSDGVEKYKQIYADYDSIVLRGTTDPSKMPTPGTFFSDDLRGRIAAKLAAEKIDPIKIFFSGDDWEESASFGMSTKKSRRVFATFTYRREAACLYGVAEVIENYDFMASKYTEPEIRLEKDLTVPCSEIN